MISKLLVAMAAMAFAGSSASGAGVNGVTLSRDGRTTSVSHGSGQYAPSAFPARGAVFSNVGILYPKGLYFCCFGDTISGPKAGVGGTFSVAMQFTPTTDFDTKEVDAGVGWVAGANVVDLAIYDDAGGVPGNLLDSGRATGLGTFGQCCTMAVARVKTSLKANTPYWVVVSADERLGQNTWAAWAFNSTDQIDTVTAAYNNGTGWQPGGGAVPAPSFQVIGK